MAYDLTRLKKAAKPRYTDHTANPQLLRGMEAITDGKVTFLNNNLDYMERFGIRIGADKKAPKKDGVPSIFVIKKDARGVEKQMDLADAGIELGSKEFWYQAQLGNVFAYPAGSPNPSQISVDFSNQRPEMSLSKPVEPEEIPEARSAETAEHVYRRPNWFTRAVNKIFKKFRKEDCEIYNQRENLKKVFTDTANFRSSGKRMEKEMKQLPLDEADAQADRDKEAQAELVRNMERRLSYKTKGQTVYKDHTAPTPVYHPEYEKANGGSGYYNAELFSQLEVIDKKFEDYSVGGKPVSQDEYCGLVAAFTLLPQNGLKAYTFSPEYDPTAVETYVNLGIDKKRAEEIVVNNFTTMITADHMKGDLRNMQGNVLGPAVNPARKQVFEAREQYRKGDKKPLAEAIARGITVAVADTGDRNDSVGHNLYNQAEFANATADLLDRDPELKDLAMNKYGLAQGDYEAVKGLAAMSKADTARRKAKLELAKAALNETPLSAEQKRKYAEEIVTANLMESKLINENFLDRKENGDPNNEETERLAKKADADGLHLNGDQLKYYVKHPQERPLPPKGKLYYDQATNLMNGRKDETNVHADVLLECSDGEGVADIKKLAAEIVKAEGLAELDVQELNKELVADDKKYFGTGLVEKGHDAALGLLKPKAPEVEAPKKDLEKEGPDPLNTGFDLGHRKSPVV